VSIAEGVVNGEKTRCEIPESDESLVKKEVYTGKGVGGKKSFREKKKDLLNLALLMGHPVYMTVGGEGEFVKSD